MPKHHDFLAMAMMQSVKSVMNARFIQQTDEKSDPVEGVDEVIRKERTGDFIEHRFGMMSEFDFDYICLDYDVIVQKDLTHVFNDEFDLCFVRKAASKDKFKLNSGVMFIRKSGKGFWNEVLEEYKPIKDGWINGQWAKFLAAEKTKLNIKYLGDSYNYSPRYLEENVDEKHVVHFKGQRKEWMAHKYLQITRA